MYYDYASNFSHNYSHKFLDWYQLALVNDEYHAYEVLKGVNGRVYYLWVNGYKFRGAKPACRQWCL